MDVINVTENGVNNIQYPDLPYFRCSVSHETNRMRRFFLCSLLLFSLTFIETLQRLHAK